MSDHDLHDQTGDGPGSDDTESLLGAYVLHALDDVERQRVERLLASDPAARAEVDRLDAAADHLAEAAAAGATAPPDLFGSLMAEVARRPRTGQSAPTSPPAVEPVLAPSTGPTPSAAGGAPSGGDVVDLQSRAASPRRARSPWILSAAAVLVLVVVGALVVGSRDSGTQDPVAAMEELAAEAATMPGARTGELTDAGNTMALQVVVDPQGHAFVMSDVLPALPEDQTYQLWSAEGGTMISVGLLGSNPTMSVIGVDPSVTELAVTIEPVGGSPGPTSAPMASGALREV